MNRPKRVTLSATAAGTGSNSYVTLDFAEAYFAPLLDGDEWFAFPKDRREVALMSATHEIDALIGETGLDGTKYYDDSYGTSEQALLFPRSVDLEPATGTIEIPEDIEKATCELALWLLKRKRSGGLVNTQEMRDRGVRSLSLDGMSIVLGKAAFKEWPRNVRKWVSQFWARGGTTAIAGGAQLWHDYSDDGVVAV